MRRYRQNTRAASRIFHGEAAVITPEDRRIHILNPTATEIWELCRDDARTLVELCEALAHRFDASTEAIRADTLELLDELCSLGALVVTDTARLDSA